MHVTLTAIFESGQSSCMEAAATSALKQMLSSLSAGMVSVRRSVASNLHLKLNQKTLPASATICQETKLCLSGAAHLLDHLALPAL